MLSSPGRSGCDIRLVLEHVERGAGDHAVTQRDGECGLVDDGAARGVHEVGVVAHAGERRGVDQVARLRQERRVERDDVRAGEQLVELDPTGLVAVHGVGVDDLHPERTGASGDRLPDRAEADDAERLAAQPATEHELDRPRPRLA